MRQAALLFALLSVGCGRTAVSTAAVRLAHPDAAERLAAVRELDRRPQSGALRPLLRTALGDPDPQVRREAALALESARGQGDSLERLALEELSRSRDVVLAGWLLESRLDAVRCGAIEALRSLGTPAAWARLADRMPREASSGVRMICAHALASGLDQGAGSSQGRVAEALNRGMEDPELPIRRICAKALALAGEPCAAGVLAAALRAPETTEAERKDLLELLRVATGEDLGQAPGPWIQRYGGTQPADDEG